MTLYFFNDNHRYGLIDERGKIVVKAKYETTGRAGGAYSYGGLRNDRVYLDPRGKKLFVRSLPYTVEFGDGDLAVIPRWDAKLERTRAAFIAPDETELAIDADDVYPPREGLAVACRDRGSPTATAASWWDGTSGPYGYVDLRGRWKIEPAFTGASAFDGGIAAVAAKRGKWGAIDARGAWRVQPKYARALTAGDGLITVANAKDRWGLVDGDGRVIIKPRFIMPLRFSGGISAARETPDRAGFVNTGGDWAVNPTYAEAGEAIGDALPVAIAGRTREPRWGLVTREGETIVEPVHSSLGRDRGLFIFTGAYRRTKPYPWGYLAPNGDVIWSGTR